MTDITATDNVDNGTPSERVVPQTPKPALGVLLPLQPPQQICRVTRLSHATHVLTVTRYIKGFLYIWTASAILLGIVLACLVLYITHFKSGGTLAPTLPFNQTAYGALAIIVASSLGLYGLIQHRKCVTKGQRNYALGIFTFLGTAAAIVLTIAGAMALSLAHTLESMQFEKTPTNRAAILETKIIVSIHSQVVTTSSSWRNMQDELKCCGYDDASAIQIYLASTSLWNSALHAAIDDVNAIRGSYCTSKCNNRKSEEKCLVSEPLWCRSKLLHVVHENYTVLSTYAITSGAIQIVCSAFGLFTLYYDNRRLHGSSPIFNIPRRMLSPLQLKAPEERGHEL